MSMKSLEFVVGWVAEEEGDGKGGDKMCVNSRGMWDG